MQPCTAFYTSAGRTSAPRKMLKLTVIAKDLASRRSVAFVLCMPHCAFQRLLYRRSPVIFSGYLRILISDVQLYPSAAPSPCLFNVEIKARDKPPNLSSDFCILSAEGIGNAAGRVSAYHTLIVQPSRCGCFPLFSL